MKQNPTLYCDVFHQAIQAFIDGKGFSGRPLGYPEMFRLDCMIMYFTKSPNFKIELSRFLTEDKRMKPFQSYAQLLLRDVEASVSSFEKQPDPRLSEENKQQVIRQLKNFSENIVQGLTKIYSLTNYDSSFVPEISQNITSNYRASFPFIKRKYDLRGSVWVMPMASYEFPPAFYLWKGASKAIDLVLIRGLKGPPVTNLRWMASYASTLCFLLVVFVLGLLFFGRK